MLQIKMRSDRVTRLLQTKQAAWARAEYYCVYFGVLFTLNSMFSLELV